MATYDIESLRRSMLHSEYDTAQGIRQGCYENGLSLAMTVAIAYKCGLIDGGKDNTQSGDNGGDAVNMG